MLFQTYCVMLNGVKHLTKSLVESPERSFAWLRMTPSLSSTQQPNSALS